MGSEGSSDKGLFLDAASAAVSASDRPPMGSLPLEERGLNTKERKRIGFCQ